MRRAARAVILLLLAAAAGVAFAQSRPGRNVGDHAGPAALDSPAWRDLMAEPWHYDDTMAYHAAAVAARWGRRAEAATLRDHLLALHGQALVAGPPAEARLGDLLARPRPGRGEIQTAWDTGLNHAWADPRWEAAPPVVGLPPGATPWPARPGFWRTAEGGVAAHVVVHNRSRMVLALPGALHLGLRGGDVTVALTCTLIASTGRWLAGEAARLWCASPGPVPAAAWPALADAAPRWRSNLPEGEDGIEQWVDRLAGRQPLRVGNIVERHAHCRDQKNCLQGKVPTTEELARWRAEAQAREPEDRARMQRERARADSARSLYLWGSIVAGFAIYALVARAASTTWATALTIGLSIAAALWLFGEARSSSGWGAMGLFIMAFGAPVYGVMLGLIYRWLYRRFLAPG